MNLSVLSVATAVGMTTGLASATVLTFDPMPGNGVALNNAYGDRVVSAMQDGFSYGLMFGPTPNIEVSYGSASGGSLLHWGPSYGDLENIVYGPAGGQEVRVAMSADDGWLVELHGFDVAGWPNADYTINEVRVEVDGQVAFSESDAFIRGATADGEGKVHTSYDFGRAIVGSEVTIVLDVANIGAGSQDNIGIDNIAFGQVVPGPGVIAVLGAAGFAAGRRRR
ncbi:MAG: hypothetical protein AAF297_00385 [Planctomycetota bacterium]